MLLNLSTPEIENLSDVEMVYILRIFIKVYEVKVTKDLNLLKNVLAIINIF